MELTILYIDFRIYKKTLKILNSIFFFVKTTLQRKILFRRLLLLIRELHSDYKLGL